MTRAIQKAVAITIEEHRRDGDPIVVWQDGKVVEIPASEIQPLDPRYCDVASATSPADEREPARSA